MMANIHAAWIGFLLGGIAGMIPGLFFHRSDWLGGYASWPRRLIRLGHIAFFGIGLLNLGFAFTARTLQITTGLNLASTFLIVAAASMPLVCYLSAWKPAGRHLFPVPALSLTLGIGLFVWRIFSL